MLCSIVSELSTDIQKQLLGSICSGHNLICTGDPGFENVFLLPDSTVEEATNIAQMTLESLRNKWSAELSCTIIQREVCCGKNKLVQLLIFSFQFLVIFN